MSLFVLWFFSSGGGESLKESAVVCTFFGVLEEATKHRARFCPESGDSSRVTDPPNALCTSAEELFCRRGWEG